MGGQVEIGGTRTLEELLEDEKSRAELCTRGLKNARSTYAWKIIARKLLEFFDELRDEPGNWG